ncbi:hypothetical protein TWF481_010916 [Arthrobotrys musiformis]|uniref:Uncharacterized protein n=1 Tax=Arthrobotrys musiformis TaxID=47236 RepID=A0AAV9VYN1_9PEZI
MPLPWKKENKKTAVPEEAPTLPPLLPPSTSLDEVKAAMDEVVARRATEEAKDGRLAAKGVELLGPDAFLFEGRLYREKSKGRWEATEAEPAEIAALRAAKNGNPSPPARGPSPGRLMPAREKRGLGKLKTLFSKSSKSSSFGGLREGRALKGKKIRVLQETAEGLQGGFIEREKAARELSPLGNDFVNAPGSSATALSPSSGTRLTVDRTLVPHFASLRPSRSCVELIPLPMASAQGGQGGTRRVSNVSAVRREIFPPQNLCHLLAGSRPGFFTLAARPDTPAELLEVYFPEGSYLEITKDIAITLYRGLYDQVCNLESQELDSVNAMSSSLAQSGGRGETVSRGRSSITDEGLISVIDDQRQTKLTKGSGSQKSPGRIARRAVTRSQSFLDTVLMGASSAMNLRRETLNQNRDQEQNQRTGALLSVPVWDDGLIVNDEDDAPQMHRDVHERVANLQTQQSSAKLSVVKTFYPIQTIPSTSSFPEDNLSSHAILETSSNFTCHHHFSPAKPEAQEVSMPIFELEAIPAGTSAAADSAFEPGSIEYFVMMEGTQRPLSAVENFPNVPLAPARPEAVITDVAAINSLKYSGTKSHGLQSHGLKRESGIQPAVAPSLGPQLSSSNQSGTGNVTDLAAKGFGGNGIFIDDPLRDSGDGRYPGPVPCINRALNRHMTVGKSNQPAKPCKEAPFGRPRSGSLSGKVNRGEFSGLFPRVAGTEAFLAERALGHSVTRMREPDGDFHYLKVSRGNLHAGNRDASGGEQPATPPLSEQRLPEMAPAA